MAQLILNAGISNNDKTGDTLRAGALKIKANFAEIYNALANDGLNISGGDLLKSGSWNDVRNKPEFVALATSGEWNDIVSKPNLVVQASVPNDNIGVEGNVAGNLAYDGTNLYVAVADWDGETEIWKQIPWAGSGSGSTGDVTFNANSVIGLNNSLILKAEPNAGWNDDYGVELFNSIDNDTHFRPLNRDKGISLGFAYGQGSHVRVEGYNGQGGVAGSGDRVGIVAMDKITYDSAEWVFDKNGNFSLPSNNSIISISSITPPTGTMISGVEPPAGNGADNSYVWIGSNPNFDTLFALGEAAVGFTYSAGATGPVTITEYLGTTLGAPGFRFSGPLAYTPAVVTSSDYTPGSTVYDTVRIGNENAQWKFNPDGITNLPANTRYPSTARGQEGDKAGMLAVAGAYMYYCYADYTDGSSPIWQKVSMDNTDWD